MHITCSHGIYNSVTMSMV